MPKRRKDVILFDAPPVISAWGSAGGKKEGEGPLASVMVEHAPYSPAKGVASVRSV